MSLGERRSPGHLFGPGLRVRDRGAAAGFEMHIIKDLWRELQQCVAAYEGRGAVSSFRKVKAHTERRGYSGVVQQDDVELQADTIGNVQADAVATSQREADVA